ncbi:MAG: hypothetical protein SVX43_03705 [Cyanobacteriota bacterium]|nr:hypothetical protein [Cyanobacteriota bacterium]
MPRTKKETDALTNGHSPSEPIEQENLDPKMTPNADAEIEVTDTNSRASVKHSSSKVQPAKVSPKPRRCTSPISQQKD